MSASFPSTAQKKHVIMEFPIDVDQCRSHLTPEQARDLGRALIQKADGVAAFTPKIIPAAPCIDVAHY